MVSSQSTEPNEKAEKSGILRITLEVSGSPKSTEVFEMPIDTNRQYFLIWEIVNSLVSHFGGGYTKCK